MPQTSIFIHPSAEVSPETEIGAGCKIWAFAHIRERARLGQNCIVGRNVYIECDVVVGNNVKIQNNASLYSGIQLEDGVFVGPHVIFTNDRLPRAIRPDGGLKNADDWQITPSLVRYGAALGAGSIVIAGVSIGQWALVGSGSVVTRDLPDFALAVGNPARVIGYVSANGVRCKDQAEAQARTEAERFKEQ